MIITFFLFLYNLYCPTVSNRYPAIVFFEIIYCIYVIVFQVFFNQNQGR